MPNKQFTFEISLNVLNHLGRNLYRSFVTVLGEAISNSWDADARNVWIYIDREKSTMVIKDDGVGMNSDQFQNQFLKIGYTKRKDSSTSPQFKRPYIGRKGIGKLALLSAAGKVSILTKTKKCTEYTNGLIDNKGLDVAIEDDLKVSQYKLQQAEPDNFAEYRGDHKHGTIIHFEKIKGGIQNKVEYLKQAIALYFRFALICNTKTGDEFNIHVNGDKVDLSDLKQLADKTEFIWEINDINDPWVKKLKENCSRKFIKPCEINSKKSTSTPIMGFIASTNKPTDLKIFKSNEKVSVDLFVNGRLREINILRHIPSSRIVENYLYGQIHFNGLDDEDDRFTSSRESVVANDPKFKEMLDAVKKIMGEIINDWDKLRIANRAPGDSDNLQNLEKKERKALELFYEISDKYSQSFRKQPAKTNNKLIDEWLYQIIKDAIFNFSSYGECFIAENLIRKYIVEEKKEVNTKYMKKAKKWRNQETNAKQEGNINIKIREDEKSALSFLDIASLAGIAEAKGNDNNLTIDAKSYKPMRDAVMHTTQLTKDAKTRLKTVYTNIEGRIKQLLADDD